MTKKKVSKAPKKPSTTAGAAPEPAKKADELDMLEDIKRDEDLYISESDIANLSNFIRTTNKSFNSLGNTIVEKFTGRCSLAILHALLSVFDPDSDERDDVIRRLNIIYIVWRLPEIEPELRTKPQKNMNDVYSHPFSTFLFYAEQLEREAESMIARIIVTNNVGVIEKLTAPDFLGKFQTFKGFEVDREAFEKWEEENTEHWPEMSEEFVPISKAMKEIGCDRKEYEAGMAEAFYPLVHNPPTLLPPRMQPLEAEGKALHAYRSIRMTQPEHKAKMTSVLYSETAGDDIQDDLRVAFQDLGQTVDEYQGEVLSAMTPAEQAEAQREIALKEEWSESEISDVETESDEESDDERLAKAEFEAMNAVASLDFNEKTIEGCVDRILAGTSLTTSKTEMMTLFVRNCQLSHPQYQRLLNESSHDDFIMLFAKTNGKLAQPFLVRNALAETNGTCELFKRYIRLAEKMPSYVQALETVLKLAKEFTEHKRITKDHQDAILRYVRFTIKTCDESENQRTIRLGAMLVKKLLRENLITVEEIATDAKPFALKHTENRECTALYKLIKDIENGKPLAEPPQAPAHRTTSVTTNATSTTTTTTVVNRCGSAVIKQTSRKVVLSTASYKSMKKNTNALIQATRKITSASSSPGTKPTSSSSPIVTMEGLFTAVSAPSTASATPQKKEVKQEE
ncbi:unnamed protein product [Caenorhabditis sp. 36 PRJEB53466]|nr:unnamed protein product [Caenorhabditis sp. 36 PRJEB53466]